MDTLRFFVKNYKSYFTGKIEHEESSSLTIQKAMFTLGLWRNPARNWSDYWRIGFAFFVFFLSFTIPISGCPRDLDIPEWGKFIDIMAGIEVSFGKMCFLYHRRKELPKLILILNEKSIELRKRGHVDEDIKKLRDSFYVQEMFVLFLTNFWGIFFLVLIFVQVLFSRPLELVIPGALDGKNVAVGGNLDYWIIYGLECFLCPYVAIIMTFSDVMIGNIYNQLVLHLEVLHHDLKVMNEDQSTTGPAMIQNYIKFAKTYQSLFALNLSCEQCMRPFFINNVFATVMATTFACVEVGIMINVEWKACIKPVMYFMFITIPFFYWCWLGNRLQEKSTEVASSALVYKEQCSYLQVQKMQLIFTQMTQQPLTINAKPFFSLNFDVFVTVLKVAYQFTAVFKDFYRTHTD